MKKVLIILFSLLLFTGCAKTKSSWKDIEEEYNALKSDVEKIVNNSETYLRQDYLNAINELEVLVSGLKKGTTDEHRQTLEKITKLTHQINTVASGFNEDASTYISNLAGKIDNLIKADYEGTDDEFDSVKTDALDIIAELKNLSDEKWSKIEKKLLLNWDEADYQQIEADTLNDMTKARDLTESELDDLKNCIIDNYAQIRYGVSDYLDDIAKEIYAAAVKLEAYAEKVSSDEGEMVLNFARHTKAYVKSCYGKALDETETFENTFDEDIEIAKKWTQSVWNIITTELKA